MKKCIECKSRVYDYLDPESGFTQSICWNCGHYEDNSPAFWLSPELFKDIVRKNPNHFMRKFAHQPTGNTNNIPTRKQHH